MVVAVDDAAVATRVRDLRMVRVQRDRPGLAATHVHPVLLRVEGVARHPRRDRDGRVVLLCPVQPVREGVVDHHVVELGRRLVVVARPRRAAVDGDLRAPVVRDDHAVRVGRVDPQVVRVAVRHLDRVERLPAVHGAVHARVERVDGVRVLRVGLHVRVVPGALAQLVLAVRARPGGAAVVGAVDAALRLRLEDRPDPVGISRGDGHADLAHHTLGQAPAQLRPRVAAVGRLVDAALPASGEDRPRLPLPAPHPGVQLPWVPRVHGERGRAGRVVDREHVLPRRAAILRAEDPALRVLPEGVPQRRDVDQVRVPRVHDDAADLPRLGEADERPRAPPVHRLPQATTRRGVAADVGRAHAHVDHVRIGVGHGDGADRPAEPTVGDVAPASTVVRAQPDAAARRAHQPPVRVVDEARHGRRAPATVGPDHAVVEAREGQRVERDLCRDGWCRDGGQCEQREGRKQRWATHGRDPPWDGHGTGGGG